MGKLKHPACAAAINSSGLVPFSSPVNRVLKLTIQMSRLKGKWGLFIGSMIWRFGSTMDVLFEIGGSSWN